MGEAISEREELIGLVERLDGADRRTLLEFARFLAARRGATRVPARVDLRRPASETVVQAVKRLNASYPMLERRKLVARVGVLLSTHMAEGRDAAIVIDELEALYAAAHREVRGE